MSGASDGIGSVWSVVLDRFERYAPAGVMARLALEPALPAGWVDEVFEAHRERQHSRELLALEFDRSLDHNSDLTTKKWLS